MLESIPEAKAIVGTGDYQHIVEVLQRVEAGERVNRVSAVPTFVGDEHLPRQRTTDQAVAFLKVAEGCDYRCAFCIIPAAGRPTQPADRIDRGGGHQLAGRGCRS